MAQGFKTGGRKKGSKNKPKALVVSSTQRTAAAGNARVHADVIPALKLTPLEMMLANMQWAISEAHKIERHIAKESAPEIKLAAFKELARMRDRAQSYAVQAAPYVHPKLHAMAPITAQEEAVVVEVDPLREHLEEMARVFRLKSTN